MKSLSFLVIVLSAITSANAEKIKVKGFIYFKNDTVAVTFQIPLSALDEPKYMKIQNNVVYFNEAEEPKILEPNDAIEFRFRLNNKDIRMISVESSIETGPRLALDSRIFLKLEEEGKEVRLFLYFSRKHAMSYAGSAGTYTTSDVQMYLLQKTGGKVKRPKELSFKKDMLEYFKDCPDLCVKLENKEFDKDDLHQIVAHYNFNCK